MTIPELNREYPEFDDPKIFQHMTQLTVDHMKPISGQLRRAQHAKTTGCVIATFRVDDKIPSDLRHGVFRDPGHVFNAIVRFSNSQDKFEKDSVGTARGLAIKLMDVGGTRAIAGDPETSQDFLMVNHPVFPFPDPKAYVETISRRDVPVIGEALVFAHLALSEPGELKIVKSIRAKHVNSPLETNYWSGSPYWLGSASGQGGHAVKYSVVPRTLPPMESPEPVEDLPDDYLSQALARQLRSGDAVFDFRVQLQTDPVAMPVEDVSVEWSESASPPVTIATLCIEKQDMEEAGDFSTRCESMSFNPWHALAEHRPMGGINRLRRVVYEASFARRTRAAAGA